MAEINFTGNVGRDVKLEYTKSGSPRLKFSVADTKSRKTDTGWEEIANQWFAVTVWGPLAEHLDEHVKTGDRVKVTGEFYQRLYESRDGSQGVSLDVNAWGVQVLPKRNGGGQQQRGGSWGTNEPAQSVNSWGVNDDSEVPF